MSMIFSKETIFDQKKWTILVADLEVEIPKLIFKCYLKSIKKSDDIFFLEIDNCVILVFNV